MESTRSNHPRQAGPSKVRADALPYAQIPLCLLCLPTGERAAAQEVWAALHCHLKLGTSAQRITDEELSTVPWLVERSVEHVRKGLEILERLGMITRVAKGSSRRVGIACTLRGSRVEVAQKSHKSRPRVAAKPVEFTPDEITPAHIAMAKRLFPKRCAGLVVPGD